jgi:hypothetical protein
MYVEETSYMNMGEMSNGLIIYSLPLKKKLHTIIKMNDNINIDSTIAGSVTAHS